MSQNQKNSSKNSFSNQNNSSQQQQNLSNDNIDSLNIINLASKLNALSLGNQNLINNFNNPVTNQNGFLNSFSNIDSKDESIDGAK